MAAPEGGGEIPAWVQFTGAVGLFVVTTVAQAWRYMNGKNEPEKADHVILEQAELADMRAIRSLAPELTQIRAQLNQVFQVVNDNHRIMEDSHRIVEANREILVILQKLDRRMEVDEQVEERLRQRQFDEALKNKPHRS